MTVSGETPQRVNPPGSGRVLWDGRLAHDLHQLTRGQAAGILEQWERMRRRQRWAIAVAVAEGLALAAVAWFNLS